MPHKGFLMLDPKGPKSTEPIIDHMTRRVAAAIRHGLKTDQIITPRVCQCGAKSDDVRHYVNGVIASTLAIHYMAYHRLEVPDDELEQVGHLREEVEPTNSELEGF